MLALSLSTRLSFPSVSHIFLPVSLAFTSDSHLVFHPASLFSVSLSIIFLSLSHFSFYISLTLFFICASPLCLTAPSHTSTSSLPLFPLEEKWVVSAWNVKFQSLHCLQGAYTHRHSGRHLYQYNLWWGHQNKSHYQCTFEYFFKTKSHPHQLKCNMMYLCVQHIINIIIMDLRILLSRNLSPERPLNRIKPQSIPIMTKYRLSS